MTKQRLELTWYNKDKALIPVEDGRYGYAWVDAADPRYCETRVLAYDNYVTGRQTPKDDAKSYSERADLAPQTDNLLIRGESGDVLEALTRVPELVEKYVGQVKLVYIDPPFNTAQTFASYEDNLEHSIWLTMMRDRLLNLKRLLSSDGSIWVHLDASEVHRMRCLLDEVFGSSNFLTEFVWEKRTTRENRRRVSVKHDHILCYLKNIDSESAIGLAPMDSSAIARYSNPDNDPRGPWTSVSTTAQAGHAVASQFYTYVSPSGRALEPSPGNCWRYTKQRLEELVADNRIWFGEDGTNFPRYKKFLSEGRQGLTPETIFSADEVGTNDSAKKEILALFKDSQPFDTPKPERLLERIIHIGTNPGDIVLDCFAGSGTTAAVAQKMGRRWVTCELLDSTFNTFTLPRLEKVVNDEDPGGITCSKGERIAAEGAELPDGVSPEDAQKFTSVLNKLVSCDDALKKSPQVKALKALAKTAKTKDAINWRGGGGFQVAHLAPACYDFDPELGRVFLTPAATGELLIESVAANLGFTLYMDDYGWPFDAYRGRAQLKVHEGVADARLVDELVSQLEDGQTLVLAATAVADGTREHLRRAARGSRIILIPDDLFPYAKGGVQ